MANINTIAERGKKFIEGWVSHKSESSKAWKKYWIVLRGNVIFLFTSDKPDKKDTMVGTLQIVRGTNIIDMKSKKGFKFELSTIGQNGEMKKNLFKFSKDIDCQLWKAYILAISTGVIPANVRLLPGQQSDVYEALIEVQKLYGTHAPGPGNANGFSNGLQNTGGAQNEDYGEEIEIDDPAVRQLNKRIETLAKNALHETETPSLSSCWPLIEIPETPVAKPSSSASLSASAASSSSSHHTQMRHSASAGILPSQKSTSQPTSPTARMSFLFSNHPFYADGARNDDVPSWFVNCSRDQAEEVLTTTSKYGTVLMRASSRFPVTGNYVICFRRELNGKVVIGHYNIIRTQEGFKIDVENQHSAMACLSNVMDFFVSFAGKTAQPLTSNDLTLLLGKYQASAFPSVTEEDLDEVRSGIGGGSSSRGSGHRHSLTNSSVQPGSNRSSSIQSSTGSTSSRTSRVSFDLPNHHQVLPTDPFHHQQNNERRPSNSSSGVSFFGNHVPKSETSGSPPSYSGSATGSFYNETAPPRSPYSATGSFHNETAPRSPYSATGSFHNETAPRSPYSATGSFHNETAPRSPYSATGSFQNETAPRSPYSATGSFHNETAPRSPYSDTGSVLRENMSVPEGLEIYTNEDETLKPSTRNSGGERIFHRSNSQSTPESVFEGPPTPRSPYSATGSFDANSTYGTVSKTSQVSGFRSGPGLVAFNAHKSEAPIPRRIPLRKESEEANHRGGDAQSTMGSDTYTLNARLRSKGKLPPPPTPAKPNAHDIYQLMKPPPSEGGVYYTQSEVSNHSAGEESNEMGGQSVKQLARILQNGIAFGN